MRILSLVLGKWFFGLYFLLGLVYFVALPLTSVEASWLKSFFLAIGLMTGTDPSSYKDTLEPHSFFWALAWLMHITSWLLIPALISIVIGGAAIDIKRGQGFRRDLEYLLIEAGVRAHDAPALAAKIREAFEKKMKEPTQGGTP